jgi:lipopolysaccharide export system permease protein
MKLINLYLIKNVLAGLGISVLIATFVLLIGQFARIADLLSQGVSLKILLLFVVYRLPQALSFTIPLGVFVTTILVFNRMSADTEIIALSASGIGLHQIMAPLVLLSLILSCACYFLQFNLAPEYNFRSTWLVKSEVAKNPMQLVEDGRFVEIFEGYIIYVGKKEGAEVLDVNLYVLNQEDKVKQKIYAQRGEIQVNDAMKHLELTLYDATIEAADPDDPYDVSKIQRIKGGTLSIRLDYGGNINKKSLTRGVGEMRLSQLFARIQIESERGIDTTVLYVELHLRAALALSPFSFILLGIPLGIRMPRKESTFGLYTCVLVPLVYFILISFFETLYLKPYYKPEFLMWLPNIFCQIAGILALWLKR